MADVLANGQRCSESSGFSLVRLPLNSIRTKPNAMIVAPSSCTPEFKRSVNHASQMNALAMATKFPPKCVQLACQTLALVFAARQQDHKTSGRTCCGPVSHLKAGLSSFLFLDSPGDASGGREEFQAVRGGPVQMAMRFRECGTNSADVQNPHPLRAKGAERFQSFPSLSLVVHDECWDEIGSDRREYVELGWFQLVL